MAKLRYRLPGEGLKVNYTVVTNVLYCKYVSLYSDFSIEFTVSKVKLVLTKVSLVDQCYFANGLKYLKK